MSDSEVQEEPRPMTVEEFHAGIIEGKTPEEIEKWRHGRIIAHSVTSSIQRLFILRPNREKESDEEKGLHQFYDERIHLEPFDDSVVYEETFGLDSAIHSAASHFASHYWETADQPVHPVQALTEHGHVMLQSGILLGLMYGRQGNFLGYSEDKLPVPPSELTEEQMQAFEEKALEQEFKRQQSIESAKRDTLAHLLGNLRDRGIDLGPADVLIGSPEEVAKQLSDQIADSVGKPSKPDSYPGQYL